MAYSLISSVATGGSANGVTSGSIDTSGADLIVVAASQYGNGQANATLTDSKGNTWTQLTQYHNSVPDVTRITLYYCFAPTVGSGHTFTLSRTDSYPSVAAMAFSGSITSPFGNENGDRGTAVTSVATGSITPPEDDCLVVSALGYDTPGSGATVNSSLTGLVGTTPTTGQYQGIGMAYIVQTAAGAINPTWSWSGATYGNATVASFKAGAGGPVAQPANMYRWNGSAWVAPGILKVWSGSAWVERNMYIWR